MCRIGAGVCKCVYVSVCPALGAMNGRLMSSVGRLGLIEPRPRSATNSSESKASREERFSGRWGGGVHWGEEESGGAILVRALSWKLQPHYEWRHPGDAAIVNQATCVGGPACGSLRSRGGVRGLEMRRRPRAGRATRPPMAAARERLGRGAGGPISSQGLNVTWRGGESGEQRCGGGASAAWAGPQRHFACTSF